MKKLIFLWLLILSVSILFGEVKQRFPVNTFPDNVYIGGKVGIGTTAPITQLTVAGSGASLSGTPTFPVVVNSGSGTNPGFIFELPDASKFISFWTGTNSAVLGFTNTHARLIIGTYSWANRYSINFPTTEIMSILSSGNVGIGTTSPKSKLDVTGNKGINISTHTASTISMQLIGAVETLPTSGYNEGAVIYQKSNHTLYISTKTITATNDWKPVW